MVGAGFSAVAVSGTKSSALIWCPEAVSNRRSFTVTRPKSLWISDAPSALIRHSARAIHSQNFADFLIFFMFSSFC